MKMVGCLALLKPDRMDPSCGSGDSKLEHEYIYIYIYHIYMFMNNKFEDVLTCGFIINIELLKKIES